MVDSISIVYDNAMAGPHFFRQRRRLKLSDRFTSTIELDDAMGLLLRHCRSRGRLNFQYVGSYFDFQAVTRWYAQVCGVSTQQSEYRVMLLGTMSSGKSMLMNALIGSHLLPSTNRATTNQLIEIRNVRDLPRAQGWAFRCGVTEPYYRSSKRLGPIRLRRWNRDPHLKHLLVEADYGWGPDERQRQLVLVDSPGPNAAQHASHSTTAYSYLNRSHRPPNLIVFVLDITKLLVNDEYAVLERVLGDNTNQCDIIFVLNKVDEHDPDTDGDLKSTLEALRVKMNLVRFGGHRGAWPNWPR